MRRIVEDLGKLVSGQQLAAVPGRGGITVELNPIEPDQYYGTIFEGGNELMISGWAPDWSNASTVIPPILTLAGGWDLSQVDDKAFNAKVGAALVEPD